MQTTRRRFLQASASAAAAAAIVPSLTSAQPQRPLSNNVLVVVQLSGGNDGLNTVVPFTSHDYYAARPVIAIRRQTLVPISRDLALHPSLRALKPIFDAGQLAIVNGCGHPSPSRSHFRSLEIWHTGDTADANAPGWLASLLSLKRAAWAQEEEKREEVRAERSKAKGLRGGLEGGEQTSGLGDLKIGE